MQAAKNRRASSHEELALITISRLERGAKRRRVIEHRNNQDAFVSVETGS
jgi:hypothetical protein